MAIFKGDIVRTSSGVTGEVVETWGIARAFLRLKLEDGSTLPVFEREVTEIVERPKQAKQRKSPSSRERR